MADITVTSTGAREFDVKLRVGEREQSHRVTVPEALGLPEHDLEAVVRESFAFLLERESASSIMAEFSLDEISGYFPEYRDELARRLS
jgi:hypothetical protein